MITETYRITKNNVELDDLLEDGENQLLREQLGLQPVERKTETAAPFKFRPITTEEMNVFKILFPASTAIESYKNFIPNEVLEELVAFKETCPYRIIDLTVMHPAEYDPDPVLVAGVRTENDNYNWANKIYIIARWGDALAPFVELREKAVELFKKQRLQALVNIKRQVALAIEDLDTFDLSNNRNIDIPVVYHL